MGQVQDKVVMITGAAGGIAEGIVRRFAEEGAKLVLVDSTEERLQKRVDEMKGVLGEYITAVGDLGKPEEVDAIIAKASEKFGKIDALVNTVGGYAAGTPVHETEASVLEKQFHLNAVITFIVLGRVAKHMLEKGVKGSLITILAKTGLAGAKNSAAYSASKAAAQRIVESMALELRDADIRVNGLMPSIADTEPNRKSMPNADFNKWVKPEQIADAMIFLASDASSAISGQAIGIYNKVM
jgi:NAD(P)-dependent dehydrogenase (short-subunit alcohol dehydrogenase family)